MVDVTPTLLVTIPLVLTHADVKMDLMETEPIARVFIFSLIYFMVSIQF